jgi:hypothetical protein
MKCLYITVLLLVFAIPGRLLAGEIKILGPMGITRAVKTVTGSAAVLVTIHPGAGKKDPGLKLRDVDGIAEDVKGLKVGDHKFKFSGLSGGTWKILSKQSKTRILQVLIKE